MTFRTAVVFMAFCLPGATLAAQAPTNAGSNSSIGLRVSTLGVGLEAARLLSDHFGLRVGANYFSLSRSQRKEEVVYDATLKFQAFTGVVDWYPGKRGAFHFTAGAVSNPLKFSGVGQPTDGNITLNDVEYTQAQVGVLTATAKYASVLPYVGLGFGTPASKRRGVGVVLDVGAAIGKATVGLTSSNAGSNAGLRANVAAEQAKAQDTANSFPVYPVVSLGLTYRF